MSSATTHGYGPPGGLRRPAGLPPPPPKNTSPSYASSGKYSDGYGYGGGHSPRHQASATAYAYDEQPQALKKKKKKRGKSFLEVVMRKAQKPEVILLSVWWLMTLVLVIYMAEMGGLIMAIWRPLLLLVSIPMLFFLALAFITL